MIQLKIMTFEGFAEIVRWSNEGTKDELYQWAGPGYTYPLTLNQFEQRLTTGEVNGEASRAMVYGIYLKSRDECMGTVEVALGEEATMTSSIGKLFIRKEARGKGYCGHIIEAICEEAFLVLGDNQLLLKVFHSNEAAIRCYEKAGFQKVQTMENVYESQRGPWHRQYMRLTKAHWGK